MEKKSMTEADMKGLAAEFIQMLARFNATHEDANRVFQYYWAMLDKQRILPDVQDVDLSDGFMVAPKTAV